MSPVAQHQHPAPVATRPTSRTMVAVASTGWVAAAVVWTLALDPSRHPGIGALPFAGRWELTVGSRTVAPLAVAGAVVLLGPPACRRAEWRSLVVGSAIATSLWATSLALGDGWDAITRPLTTRYEYEPHAATIDDLGTYLRHYVDALPGLPTHVRGHPPGPVVLAWLLDRTGLGGAGWLAGAAIASWGAAAALTLTTLRCIGQERTARTAAPALILAPAALWAATSFDAVIAFVGTAVVLAWVQLAATPSARTATIAGGLTALALLLSYGSALLLAIPLVLLCLRWRRDPAARRLLLSAAGGAGLTTGAALVAIGATTGFWWWDGLAATRAAYWAGYAAQRDGWYFTFVGNPLVLLAATGGIAAAGACRAVSQLRSSGGAALLGLGALLAVAVADLSQMSRSEVERIWLPFVPWLVAWVPDERRRWLVRSAAVTLVLHATLRSPW